MSKEVESALRLYGDEDASSMIHEFLAELARRGFLLWSSCRQDGEVVKVAFHALEKKK